MNTWKWMVFIVAVSVCGFFLGHATAPQEQIIEIGIINEIESIKEVKEWSIYKNVWVKTNYAMNMELEIEGMEQEVKFREDDYRDFYYDLIKVRELIDKQMK